MKKKKQQFLGQNFSWICSLGFTGAHMWGSFHKRLVFLVSSHYDSWTLSLTFVALLPLGTGSRWLTCQPYWAHKTHPFSVAVSWYVFDLLYRKVSNNLPLSLAVVTTQFVTKIWYNLTQLIPLVSLLWSLRKANREEGGGSTPLFPSSKHKITPTDTFWVPCHRMIKLYHTEKFSVRTLWIQRPWLWKREKKLLSCMAVLVEFPGKKVMTCIVVNLWEGQLYNICISALLSSSFVILTNIFVQQNAEY